MPLKLYHLPSLLAGCAKAQTTNNTLSWKQKSHKPLFLPLWLLLPNLKRFHPLGNYTSRYNCKKSPALISVTDAYVTTLLLHFSLGSELWGWGGWEWKGWYGRWVDRKNCVMKEEALAFLVGASLALAPSRAPPSPPRHRPPCALPKTKPARAGRARLTLIGRCSLERPRGSLGEAGWVSPRGIMGLVVVPSWSHVTQVPCGPHGGPRQGGSTL